LLGFLGRFLAENIVHGGVPVVLTASLAGTLHVVGRCGCNLPAGRGAAQPCGSPARR
jgi:hypothetical protein